MTDFSSVCGTIFLKGNWTQKAFNAIVPIWGYWSVHGKIEYDIVAYGNLTLQNPKASFKGYGNGLFSKLLGDLNSFVWDYISECQNASCAIRYRTLIDAMKEQNLSIMIEFCSEEAKTGFTIHETGEILSDGEGLLYRQISCEKHP